MKSDKSTSSTGQCAGITSREKDISMPVSADDFCDTRAIYLELVKEPVNDLPPVPEKGSSEI